MKDADENLYAVQCAVPYVIPVVVYVLAAVVVSGAMGIMAWQWLVGHVR